MGRLARPLNQDAVKKADDEFYANHPEYIDENGNRIPLSANDPNEEALRQEWIELYKKHGGKEEADKKPPKKDPDDPVQPCPIDEVYTLACRWIDTNEYCGDNARLEVTVTPTPPDGDVTVNILHPESGGTVDTLQGTMTGGRWETTWIAKSQTANWRTDKIKFRASVSSVGLSGESSNEFTFKNRPTTAWVLVSTTRPVPASCGSGAGKEVIYDIKLESNRVHQSVKLHAWGDAALDNATKTAFQQRAKSQIETVWNNGFNAKKMHRVNCQRGDGCDCSYDCCKVEFRLDVNFVASGSEHWKVKVIPQPDPAAPSVGSWVRYNDSQWGYPPKSANTTYAHEFGHMVGQYDEYVTSCNDPSAAGTKYRQPAPPPAAEINLMSTAQNTTLLNRHYRLPLKFLNDNANGDEYDIIPPGP